MRQIDRNKWRAGNLKEFSEKIALAVCTPQIERHTTVNAWINRVVSSGEDAAYIINLSCFARFHPFHKEKEEECLEFSGVLSGGRNEKYEEFHPAVDNYFNGILRLINDYSPDLHSMIRSKRVVKSERSLSLDLFLDS